MQYGDIDRKKKSNRVRHYVWVVFILITLSTIKLKKIRAIYLDSNA